MIFKTQNKMCTYRISEDMYFIFGSKYHVFNA